MRSDILVSVGVIDEHGPRRGIPRLAEVIAKLSLAFEYFEVLYVMEEQYRCELDAMAEQISGLTNLRIILTTEGTHYYHRRLVTAREAIGDVVALYDPDEISVEELTRKLGESKDRNEILAGWFSVPAPTAWTYRLLAFSSHYIITAQAARTLIIPREWLNTLLVRRSAVLDLRFQARVSLTRYCHFDIPKKQTKGSNLSGRYELLREVMLCDAPRYLKGYAFMGFLVVLGTMAYIAYAIAIVLLRPHVQEGWFSNAVVEAASTAFIATGMSLIALALVTVLDVLQGTSDRIVVAELSNISFFDKVGCRNVEVG
ncbi:hypothetical protein [Acetobacter sp. LMG 32666]|uniref:hypothetical protein n=1 Tax=Acetobacter sp. LMG 32666 TaxID=2959295 RepID=UPI0030C88BFB